jgi:hypothetical protein
LCVSPTPLAVVSSRTTTSQSDSNDDVLDAFDKNFHYLNPFQPSAGNWNLEKVDQLLEVEANDFFDGFEFSLPVATDLEDDDVFGDLLEQMIQ